jgi:ribose transport system substrate-binding protein
MAGRTCLEGDEMMGVGRRYRLGILVGLVAVGTVVGVNGAFGGARAPTGKKLFVAYEDGSCANSLRVIQRAEFIAEARHHPEIEKYVYSCAEGSLAKFISDVQSLVAQGVDVLAVQADQGNAVVPTLRMATRKGVTVVPWTFALKGEGKDFYAQVRDDVQARGTQVANFFIKKLHGHGNVVCVCGPAGNTEELPHIKVIKKVFAAKAPGMKWLDNGWGGDWNPAKMAAVMATLITKYPKIDAVWADEGSGIPALIRQFQAAGRPLPTFHSNELNGMMKLYFQLKPKNPTLNWGFWSARTWGVRNALIVGLQAHEGKKVNKSLLSIKNYTYDCDIWCKKLYAPSWPDSYLPTNHLTPRERETILRPLLTK